MSALTQAQRWMIAGLLGAIVLIAGIVVLVVDDDEPGEPAATTSTTTTTASTTTTTSTSTSTTTTTAVTEVDGFDVAFPNPETSRRFDGADAAALAFAIEVLGFDGPERISGDGPTDADVGTSHDVAFRLREAGPVTTIRTEVADDGSWYVLGSTTPDIVVDAPLPFDSLATPFETMGRALAFEGTVDVEVRAQDGTELGSGFVTGSGTPPPGPFSARISYEPPPRPVPGVVIYRTLSARDGSVEQAVAVAVRLTDKESPTPDPDASTTTEPEPVASGDCDAPSPSPAAEDERVVRIWLVCTADGSIVETERRLPLSEPRILAASIEAIIEGPTPAESGTGLSTPFDDRVSLDRVVIEDGVAVIDLLGLDALPNASATILGVEDTLVATASQYPSVAAVEIRIDGSCVAYADWSQSDSCLRQP